MMKHKYKASFAPSNFHIQPPCTDANSPLFPLTPNNLYPTHNHHYPTHNHHYSSHRQSLLFLSSYSRLLTLCPGAASTMGHSLLALHIWGWLSQPLHQQLPPHHQHRAPSSGPHRNYPARSRQVEPTRGGLSSVSNISINLQNRALVAIDMKGSIRRSPITSASIIHESFGIVVEDRSTGFNPGNAWIDASKNTGGGKVRRTPTKNPSMADCNLT